MLRQLLTAGYTFTYSIRYLLTNIKKIICHTGFPDLQISIKFDNQINLFVAILTPFKGDERFYCHRLYSYAGFFRRLDVKISQAVLFQGYIPYACDCRSFSCRLYVYPAAIYCYRDVVLSYLLMWGEGEQCIFIVII